MKYITTENADGVLIVTLDRPDARNAVHAEMRAEFRDALSGVNEDAGVRAVVITGAGDKAFCAGNDLAETASFDIERAVAWVSDLERFLTAIRSLDKPCAAAVNGVAAGGGLQVALLCDVRIGHAGTRIGQPEINVGLASVIGVQLLDLALGHLHARDFALTGRLADAEEALRLGLLSKIVARDHVLDEAIAAANDLAARPPNAFRLTKERLREMTQTAFDGAFVSAARLQRLAYESGEPQAVMARFFESRSAR